MNWKNRASRILTAIEDMASKRPDVVIVIVAAVLITIGVFLV